MAYLVDYHCHTGLSADAKGSPREVCLRAVEIGLAELAFTDHVDTDPSDPCYGHYDYERAFEAAERCREEFAGRLAVRLGVEIDYQERHRDEAVRAIGGRGFDVVIGSVHYLAGRPGWIVPTTATPFAARSARALTAIAARTATR